MNTTTQAGAGLDTTASETAVDRAFGDNSIDTLLSEIESQDDTETVTDETEADDTEQAASESDEEADGKSVETEKDTAKNGKSDQKTATPKGKGVGWDKVLQVLDQTDPQAAAAARTFQGEWSKIKQQEADAGKRLEDAKSLQNQLREALDEVKAIKDSPEEQQAIPTLEELLPNVPPSQREAFKTAFEVLKDQMGLVSRDEIQSTEDKKAQAEYVKSLHTEHAKKHGEQFGTVTGKGELIISPELKPKLEAVRERLASNRQGVTWADLHILANHDEIVKSASEKAVADYRASLKDKNSQKVSQLKKGRTIEGSTSTGGTKFARMKGESSKQTIDRAFDLAWNTSVPGR